MIRPKDRFPREISHHERKYYYAMPSERWRHPEMKHVMELYFDGEGAYNPYDYPDGLWAFGGGVSWPMFIQDEGLVGIAHLAGLHLESRTVYFFSERPFIIIAPSPGYPPDAPRPLFHWLESNYELFHALTYCYQDSQTIASKFKLAVARKYTKRPRPSFIMFNWIDDSVATQTVYEYDAIGRLRIPESRLMREMLGYDADPSQFYPALISGTVTLNGIDRAINNDRLIQKALDKHL